VRPGYVVHFQIGFKNPRHYWGISRIFPKGQVNMAHYPLFDRHVCLTFEGQWLSLRYGK
jgi:hypothetical protein